LVAFPLKDGKTLVSRLMKNQETDETEFGILERETIIEVGNILIDTIACSFSEIMEVDIDYDAPIIDISNNIFENKAESRDGIYCLGEGQFSVKGAEIQGAILFILSYNKIESVMNKFD